MQLQLPDNFSYFSFQFDGYRQLWETFCIAPIADEPYWFKGHGATVEESLAQLCEHVRTGTHVAKWKKATWGKDTFTAPAIRADTAQLTLGTLDL